MRPMHFKTHGVERDSVLNASPRVAGGFIAAGVCSRLCSLVLM